MPNENPVLARHIVLAPGDDDQMHGELVIVVTGMVPEGEVLEFEPKHTGGLPEVLVGPETYEELEEEASA